MHKYDNLIALISGIISGLLIMCLLLSGCVSTPYVATHSATTTLLVKYKDGVKGVPPVLSGVKGVSEIPEIGVTIYQVPASKGISVLKQLRESLDIEWAEYDPVASPDVVPNDTYYSKQWHLKKIACPSAWDSTLGDSSVIIAICDTGVNSLHPDLAANIVAGWNTYDNNADTSDVYGHGTQVAGCAAAAGNNAVGIAGVAYGCKIMPMRISDKSGLGYGSTIASALVWAANHGARVANVSFRMDFSATVTAAAQYFMSNGGVVVMSAGNESKTFTAATDNPYIITVGATTSSDTLCSWSNQGANVDLVAPGASIYTTNRSGGYSSVSGTSFSAPIAAGVAGLILSKYPGYTGEQVVSALKSSTDNLGLSLNGTGRLNAARAVGAYVPPVVITPPPVITPIGDTTPPVIAITSPLTNAEVTGVVTIKVTATDNVGVVAGQLLVDNVCVAKYTGNATEYQWDTSGIVAGKHLVYCKAQDVAKNWGTSTKIYLWVK